MTKYTRGEFLEFSTALADAFTLDRRPTAATQTPAQTPTQTTSSTNSTEPDLIVVNATVYTSDTTAPHAEAFTIKNDRFTTVGSTANVRNLTTHQTQTIDAQHMTITPGFIDAHYHPSSIEELYGVNTNLRTVQEIQTAIKKKTDTTPIDF